MKNILATLSPVFQSHKFIHRICACSKPSLNPSFLILLCTLLLIKERNGVEAENILFFYGGGTYSHKHAIFPLTSALADRGHNVTFLSPHKQAPWTHPNISDLVPEKLEKLLSVFHLSDKLQLRVDGNERKVWNTLSEWSLNICKTLLNDASLNALFYDTQFDLIFVNACFGECAYLLNVRWKAKIILTDSTSILPYFNDMLGLTLETHWIPDISSQFWYPMTYFDRIRNFFYSLTSFYERSVYLYPELEKLMQEHLVKDGSLTQNQIPSFLDMERKNTSLVFLNTHYSTDFARSASPNIIQIGGLQLWEKRRNPIKKEMQDFMDKAEDGVVLIVFGTSYSISQTSETFLDIFFKTIKAFPKVNFIVNWEGEQPSEIPKNLYLSKWLAQREILEHPSMKAFISHCGLYSLSEATFNAVPIICLPLVADEDYDAYRIEQLEIGLRLEVKTMTADDLIKGVDKVLTNPKYKKNIEKMSRITRDRPMNPIDVGLWWTDFVLRQDDLSSLRPQTDDLSWIELRSLDVHMFLFAVLLLSTYFIAKFTHFIVGKLFI